MTVTHPCINWALDCLTSVIKCKMFAPCYVSLHRYYSTISLCIILNMAFAWVAKIQAELSKYIGKGEVNISASIRTPHTKLFGVPETHKNIFVCVQSFEIGCV